MQAARRECCSPSCVSCPSGVVVDLPTLTEKDVDDIVNWGVGNEIDLIAASFVRKGHDLDLIREVRTAAAASPQLLPAVAHTNSLHRVTTNEPVSGLPPRKHLHTCRQACKQQQQWDLVILGATKIDVCGLLWLSQYFQLSDPLLRQSMMSTGLSTTSSCCCCLCRAPSTQPAIIT